MEEGMLSRHCAFCFIPIAEKDVKKCGKCLRRVYCGQKCQKEDWKSKKVPDSCVSTTHASFSSESNGQGHKDWCGIPVCEEDLDWVVKEGGKGVVAKRLILKGEKILVGNTLQYKERTEKHPPFGIGHGMLFNHACDPNSVLNSGMEYEVGIVNALEDIEPGTEITMSYVGFNQIFAQMHFVDIVDRSQILINSFAESRAILRSRYGLICPSNCFCYNEEIEKIILKRKEFNENLTLPMDHNEFIQHLIDEISEYDTVRGDRVVKGHRICALLKLMSLVPKYSHLIPKYRKEAEDIFKVFHPNSAFCRVERWMEYFNLN